MYHEFGRSAARQGFRYTYKGSELLTPARNKLAEYVKQEGEIRERLSAALKDSTISLNSKEIDELKRRGESIAEMMEECSVYASEFERQPEADYDLGLGDVVFFNLVRKPGGWKA